MAMFELVFTTNYERRAAKFIRRHPELRRQYRQTLELLELDPFHPSLGLHRLQGTLHELHAVSINISYRITLELLIREKTLIPVNVGSHDEVYRYPGDRVYPERSMDSPLDGTARVPV